MHEGEKDLRENSSELAEREQHLKTAIADTLLEIDDIKLQVNPRIEVEYSVKIGCWEVKLLREQIAARRARRKFELAQMSVNKGSAVDEQACELVLDEEFAEWEARLSTQLAVYNNAVEKRLNTEYLNSEESRELKRLHRTLVKRLHPDIHPAQDENAKKYFDMAQRAYEHGDLDVLRSLEAATSTYEEETAKSVGGKSSEDRLLDIALLEAQLGHIESQLASLKATNPYLLLDKVSDQAWVERTVSALKALIDEQKTIRVSYEERFRALIKREM